METNTVSSLGRNAKDWLLHKETLKIPDKYILLENSGKKNTWSVLVDFISRGMKMRPAH